jgi:hypothetical protein
MRDLTHDYQEVFERVFILVFSAALIYLPPRIFYLSEDAHRPLTWFFILPANLPLTLRIFFT